MGQTSILTEIVLNIFTIDMVIFVSITKKLDQHLNIFY